jgi:hypothetical protein
MSTKPDCRQVDCWPAGPREWLTAQGCVRFGRFDRFPWFRRGRLALVDALARHKKVISFRTRYGFDMFLPCGYRGLITMALGGFFLRPGFPRYYKRWFGLATHS